MLMLAGCMSAASWKRADGDVALQIPPSVLAKLEGLEGGAGQSRLVSIKRRVDDAATGNFGMHFYSNSELMLSAQDRLLQVAEVRRWAPPDAPTTGVLVADASSVCGLVDILREEQDVAHGSFSMAIGNFIHTQSSTASMFRRSRLDTLESSVALCRPVAGTSFSYRVVHAMQRHWVGPKINQLATIDRTFRCTVGAVAHQGSELTPAVRGDYLDVKCTAASTDGDHESTNYAFLIDGGLYLPLEATDAAGTRKYKYLDPVYR